MKRIDIFGIKNKEIKLIGTSLKIEDYPLEFCIYPSLNKTCVDKDTRKIIEEKIVNWISLYVALEKLAGDDDLYNAVYRLWNVADNELYKIKNLRIRIIDNEKDINIFDSEQTKFRKIYYKKEYQKILLFTQTEI